MSAFGDAFAAARKAGKKTFKFNGKLYTTKTKEESAPATSQRPQPRPSNKPAGSSLTAESRAAAPSKPTPEPTTTSPRSNAPVDSKRPKARPGWSQTAGGRLRIKAEQARYRAAYGDK